MHLLRKSLSFLFLLLLLSTALQAEFAASKNSNKYHQPSCVWAQRIKPQNRIVFKTTKEAEAAGYVACKVCKPREGK